MADHTCAIPLTLKNNYEEDSDYDELDNDPNYIPFPVLETPFDQLCTTEGK